jgi:hypothetical protein
MDKQIKPIEKVFNNKDLNIAHAQGKLAREKEIIKIIQKQIKLWENTDNNVERYYGATGCVVKMLDDLIKQIQEHK